MGATGIAALVSWSSFAGAGHNGAERAQELAAARQVASASVAYQGLAATLNRGAQKAHDEGNDHTAYHDSAAAERDTDTALADAEAAANDAGAADGALNNRQGDIVAGTVEAGFSLTFFVSAGGFAIQAFNRRGPQ